MHALSLSVSLSVNQKTNKCLEHQYEINQKFKDYIDVIYKWWNTTSITSDYTTLKLSIIYKAILQNVMLLNNTITNYNIKHLDLERKKIEEDYKLDLLSLYLSTYCCDDIKFEVINQKDSIGIRCKKVVLDNIRPNYFDNTDFSGIEIENMYKLTNKYLFSQLQNEKNNCTNYYLKGLFITVPSHSIPHIVIYGFSTSHKEKRVKNLWYTTPNDVSVFEKHIQQSPVVFPPFIFSKFSTVINSNISNDKKFFIILCRVLITDCEIINKPENKFPDKCYEKKRNYFHNKTQEYIIQRHQCILPEFFIQFHYIPRIHYPKYQLYYPIDLRNTDIIIPEDVDYINKLPEEIYKQNPDIYIKNLENIFQEVINGDINYDLHDQEILNDNSLSQCVKIKDKAKTIYPHLYHKLLEIEKLLFDKSQDVVEYSSLIKKKCQKLNKSLQEQLTIIRRKNEDLQKEVKKTRSLQRLYKIRSTSI